MNKQEALKKIIQESTERGQLNEAWAIPKIIDLFNSDRISDYKLISYYNSPTDLERDVNLAIEDGYVPFEFNVQVATILDPKDASKFTSLLIYTQLMVKYGEPSSN